MPDPFPAYRSLNPRGVSSFHLGPRSPSERLTSPEPPTRWPVSTSWDSLALRRHHSIEPRKEQAVPGPLRFRSQVFSTSQRFPGKIELRGLVSCRYRPDFSFRACPSQESCSPLGVTSSPAVIDQRAEPHLPGLSPAVSPTATPKRSSKDPRLAMGHLSAGARTHPLPGFPEPRQTDSTLFRQLRLLRSLTPPVSPFRTDKVIHPGGRRNSPGLSPLQSTTSHTLGSRTRPGLTARARVTHPQRGDSRRRGPCDPRVGWDLIARERTTRSTRRIPASFETGPHRLSAVPRLP